MDPHVSTLPHVLPLADRRALRRRLRTATNSRPGFGPFSSRAGGVELLQGELADIPGAEPLLWIGAAGVFMPGMWGQGRTGICLEDIETEADSIANSTAFVVTGQSFRRKRGLAIGVLASGSSLGLSI